MYPLLELSGVLGASLAEQEKKLGTLQQCLPGKLWKRQHGDHTPNRQLNLKSIVIIGSESPLPKWGSLALCQAGAEPGAVDCPRLLLRGRRSEMRPAATEIHHDFVFPSVKWG